MSVPRSFVTKVSAWLAREGYTIMTAPPSLVALALEAVKAETTH
jgi:hypothetical protein